MREPDINTLYHHGILGQKWGVRRYQNEDGSLTNAGKERYGSDGGLSKKDVKWANKNSDKITARAEKQTSKELAKYDKQLLKVQNAYNKNGRLSAAVINAHNQMMAELMNEKVSNLTSPSGKAVKFVAKRGEVGVMFALADQGYNIEQLKKGVYTSGKVAYKKTVLDTV